MSKYRSGILFVGLVFITSAFSFLYVFGSPSYYYQKCTNNEKKSAEELRDCRLRSEFVETLKKDPTAYFTECLVFFTGVLGVVSVVQIFFLIRSDATARVAANAAVDALRNLERPAIFVEVQKARIFDHQPHHIEFIVRNHGRATAIIKNLICYAGALEIIPLVPHYRDKRGLDRFVDMPIRNDQSITETCLIEGSFESVRQHVQTKRTEMLFHGWIDYTDAFGAKFITRFGYLYRPRDDRFPHQNDVFVPCHLPGYNERT